MIRLPGDIPPVIEAIVSGYESTLNRYIVFPLVGDWGNDKQC